jgi:hypothetical protein
MASGLRPSIVMIIASSVSESALARQVQMIKNDRRYLEKSLKRILFNC